MAGACKWENENINKAQTTTLEDLIFADGAGADKIGDFLNGSKQEKLKDSDDYPGAMNAGWDDYYEWANKDFRAWGDAFDEAECQRIEESKRWLKYYEDVYENDSAWWKKVIMFALNGIQLWALWRQFRIQKKIADNTWSVANRIQEIAEETFDFYKSTYLPHELALGEQINEYFQNACVDYTISDRFANNVKQAFAKVKADAMRCSSSACGMFTPSQVKQWEIEQARATGNARSHAFRYAELNKDRNDNFWLDLRMKYIQIGRNVSQEGQGGVMKAFQTFSSFGADPGAALSQLLGTFSHTMGQMISTPVAPAGQIAQFGSSSQDAYAPYFGGVKLNGDVQVGKASRRL